MSLRAPVSLYQHRGSVIVTPPATEPVTAADLRTHLATDATALPDPEANALIAEAREYIENASGLAFISQTWRLALDRWPAGNEAWWDGVRDGSIADLYGSNTLRTVELPKWPLASITSVTTYDEASNATSVTVADFFDVDLYSRPGRLSIKRGQTWPIALRPVNAIEIDYVAGYPNAAAVPNPMERAVKQLAAYLYAHRGDECDPKDAYQASGAERIMAQYKPARI